VSVTVWLPDEPVAGTTLKVATASAVWGEWPSYLRPDQLDQGATHIGEVGS